MNEIETEQGSRTNWKDVARRNEQHWKDEATRRVDTERERDGAYRERAQLLAWLATVVPAVITPAPDVDEPGWQILFLAPGGSQLSWHIAPADAELFEHVEHVGPDDPRAQWDGHTTPEKYERIRSLSFATLRGHDRT